MGTVEHLSATEKLLRELMSFADVELCRQPNGEFFVSTKPRGRSPLWWYGCHADLRQAIQICRNKAVELRFLLPTTQITGA